MKRREHLAPWVSAFKMHNVDGKVLARPDFCEQDLLELGMDVRLSRLRFLEAVKKAKKNGLELPPMEVSQKNAESNNPNKAAVRMPEEQRPQVSPIKPSTHLHGASSTVNEVFALSQLFNAFFILPSLISFSLEKLLM